MQADNVHLASKERSSPRRTGVSRGRSALTSGPVECLNAISCAQVEFHGPSKTLARVADHKLPVDADGHIFGQRDDIGHFGAEMSVESVRV